MASRERREDRAGFSTWFRDTMRRRGYDIDAPRGGGQKQLASDSGVSDGAISKILSGESIPKVELMAKLADALGVTLREMLLRSGKALPDDLVADSGNPIVDPMLDKIYAMQWLPIDRRKQRAEDYLRRVDDAVRLAEMELEADRTEHERQQNTRGSDTDAQEGDTGTKPLAS